MNEIEHLRAQLAAANEARERAEKRGEKAALALTRAHEVIALQRNEINPEKYPEIDEAAGDVLDPCDEMADNLDKALNDLDLAQKALRAAESRAERMAKLLREAHPVVFHAANLMTGEMARAGAGRLANRIRAVLAEVAK